ncbi:MAG: DUF4395 domain-containing protein [Acidimicrobiia bacterium]
MRRLFSFPDPVNEYAARWVAGFVVVLSGAFVLTGWKWLCIVLAYGFVARVCTGPTLSPLGQFVTRAVIPALGSPNRPTAGPPKRFAQGIGATLSVTALVLAYGFDAVTAARVVVGMITVAATLESVFGFCLGCWIFARLMRIGLVPASVCEACNDLSKRVAVNAH